MIELQEDDDTIYRPIPIKGTVIPKIDGKTVRCEVCNSNCFHYIDMNTLKCNGCAETYEVERKNK